MGKDIGKRFDALFRDRLTKRELTEVGILKFISTTAWKALWGKEADSLERSNERGGRVYGHWSISSCPCRPT